MSLNCLSVILDYVDENKPNTSALSFKMLSAYRKNNGKILSNNEMLDLNYKIRLNQISDSI